MKLDNFAYPTILEAIKNYSAEGRSESASFLIWYLVNIYRLDEMEAVDAVCDQKGDKGVDGIYINESNGTIDIFQCKLFQNENKKVGDSGLKEFAGTLKQFETKETVEKLLETVGDNALSRLIINTNLVSLMTSYQIRGVYLTNSELDVNGMNYLEHTDNIFFIGPNLILDSYISDKKDMLLQGEASFDISGLLRATYVVDADTHTVISPVLATELVTLNGIDDQSLFTLNVRASLGNTKVNRDIVKSIKDKALHKLFPLFHNGVTVLAEFVDSSEDTINIKNYFVVNGCQSLNALYKNKKDLTSELRVLAKFIQVPAQTDLSDLITSFSNNQNGVKPRDFKSNNPIQIRLQNEMKEKYPQRYSYEVKRGEPLNEGTAISNEIAGLYFIAFDLKEPWTTHRKYQVFDDKYNDIFGRPEVTAHRIILCHEIFTSIKDRVQTLKNQLVGKYVLTQFFMLYVVRRVLESDEFGMQILKFPEKFIDNENIDKFRIFIGRLINELMIDLNLETQELGQDFDYRGKLREKEFLVGIANILTGSFLKDIVRQKAQPLKNQWDSV
ncbi:MAG: AIPR family protein [Methylotenera sp.]